MDSKQYKKISSYDTVTNPEPMDVIPTIHTMPGGLKVNRNIPFSVLKGDKGDKGDAGAEGPQGLQGVQGPSGEDGREVEISKSSTHIQWRYEGDASWNNLVALSELKGAAGSAATVSVGSTSTGLPGSSASVVNSGTSSAAVLNFSIPRGEKGSDGQSGRTVLSGAGAPDSGIGANGDFYIDSSSWNIYGPKTPSGWGSSTSLVGPAGAGTGDMLASVYDPSSRLSDAFSMDNMVETTSKKVMTQAERTKLSGIAAGAQVNTINAGDGLSALDSAASTKLSGIESGAEVTSSAKVQAALPAGTNGQVLKHNGTSWQPGTDLNTTYSEISEAEITAGTASTARATSGRREKFNRDTVFSERSINENDMASNSDTKWPTQKSVKAYVDNNSGYRPNLVDRIIYPVYISHRNSPKIYPEESMEGQRLTAQLGFPIEIDVGALSDGTLVGCHDDTVNRTMDNIGTGNVASKTPQQWRQARIKPAIPGGKTGTPIFFDDWLDEFGGKYLLVPELKPNAEAYVQDMIDAIKLRGLENAVIAQSFSFTIASAFAAAGLRSMYLFNAAPTETPTQIANAGIQFVSGNSSMTATTVTNMKAAGLKVIMYTVNTIPDRITAITTKGCDGIFSDDPSYVSDRVVYQNSDGFEDGYGWPGIRLRSVTGDVSAEDSSMKISYAGKSLSINRTHIPGQHQYVYMPHLGKVSVPFKVSFTVRLGNTRAAQGDSFGVALFSNSSDPNSDFVDGAKTGQNGYAIVGRANGQLQAWKYVSGAAASSILSTAVQTGAAQFAEEGKAGEFKVEAEVTGSHFRISSPDRKYQELVADTFSPQNMTLAIRAVSGAEVQLSDIRVEQL